MTFEIKIEPSERIGAVPLGKALYLAKRKAVLLAMRKTKGNKVKSAKLLGINRGVLAKLWKDTPHFYRETVWTKGLPS